MTTETIPAEILESLARRKNIACPCDAWRVTRLSKNNSIYRIAVPPDSWIIKYPVRAETELLVARLFAALDIAGFEVDRLEGGWLVFEDLGLPKLADYLGTGPSALTPPLFEQLGVVAMQADLVGMRDRKLGNLLVRQSEEPRRVQLVMVDYEGAFGAGLFERWFRPHRYISYLTTRLFFDVLFRALGRRPNTEERDAWLRPFREGMFEEQARLNTLIARGTSSCRRLTFRQRLVCQSRVSRPERLERLVSRGLLRAATKTRTRGSLTRSSHQVSKRDGAGRGDEEEGD